MANVNDDELQQLRKRARRRLVGAIALVVFALTVLWTALDGEPPKALLENQSVEIISSAPALSSVVTLDEPVQSVSASAPASSQPAVDASNVAPIPLPGKLVHHQENAPQAVPDSSQQTLPPETAPTTAPTQSPVTQITVKPSPKATSKALPKATPTPLDPKLILEGGLEQPRTAKTTATPAKQAADVGKKVYYIQIGAYADPVAAEQTLKKLKDAGIPARSEKVATEKGELTRVRIGPGTDEAKANAWMQKLEALGVPGKLVVKAAP
ncbi:SPOR domain-containing protein [Chitinibacter sp. S2-10]|uniref:SPOR domain-containing protein n=1 Tax=Chitinibacter sp. S2-10 TaxID=3373597 RepID=UPI003977D93B